VRSSRRIFLKSSAGVVAFPWISTSRKSWAGTGTRPNILLFLPDEHRYDWLGTNFNLPIRTPNIDALGERGVRFDRCICASPLCAPSRACLASGREYDRCGVNDNSVDYPVSQTTFYKMLRDQAGYHVVTIGKLDLNKGSEDWGLAGKNHLEEWGFSDGFNNAGKPEATITYEGTPIEPYMNFLKGESLDQVHVEDMDQRNGTEVFRNTEPTPLPDSAYCDNWLGRSGLDLLNAFPHDKPWFFQLNFVGPHYPMDITQSMKDSVVDQTYPQPIDSTQYTPQKHNAIRQNYSAMIENIDHWLGLFVEAVTARGEMENTIIIYASDHGEMLGDHNFWRKSQPYQPSVGVPLVLAGPGILKGRTSSAVVSLMDLAATFLDYAGLPIPADMDSISFRRVLEGRWASHRRYAFSGLTTSANDAGEIIDWRMVFDGRYKYLPKYSLEAVPYLFDLSEDPDEMKNWAEEKPNEVQRLSAALQAMDGEVPMGSGVLGLY